MIRVIKALLRAARSLARRVKQLLQRKPLSNSSALSVVAASMSTSGAPQPFFECTRFEGTLSGHGHSVPVGFTAMIDDVGKLGLVLDPLPFSQEAFAVHVHQRPTSAVDLVSLEGQSAAGHLFRSDSFHIAHFGHREGELDYQGDCYDAELVLPPTDSSEPRRDGRMWFVRQFRTFRRLVRETALGRVIIAGPRQGRDAQEPSGMMAIFHPGGESDEAWWTESDRFLTHLARVLSFASDTYFRPVLEQRFVDGQCTVRIASQGRTSPPFMAPFHELHMQPIFDCACESYFSRHDEIEQLDAAIRWLTAPVFYDESRLINAMSALENILDRCEVDGIGDFLGSSQFKKVAKKVRDLLKEIEAPDGMTSKVPELNRRTLSDKVRRLLEARGIVSSDLPADWLKMVIEQRNTIVHTGVSIDVGEPEHDTLDHTIWAREIVTRIILERMGFVGAYRSWLHQDGQLHFPECIHIQQWVAMQEGSNPSA